MIFGLLVLFIIPEDPLKSKILSPEERRVAAARIDADQVIKTGGKREKATWKLIKLAFNPIVSFCPNAVASGVSRISNDRFESG